MKMNTSSQDYSSQLDGFGGPPRQYSPRSHAEAWGESVSFTGEENPFRVEAPQVELKVSCLGSLYSAAVSEFVSLDKTVGGGSQDIDELDELISNLDLVGTTSEVDPLESSPTMASEMQYQDFRTELGEFGHPSSDIREREANSLVSESYGSYDSYSSGGSTDTFISEDFNDLWMPALEATASFLLFGTSHEEVLESPYTDSADEDEDDDATRDQVMESPSTSTPGASNVSRGRSDSDDGDTASLRSFLTTTDENMESDRDDMDRLALPTLGVSVRRKASTYSKKKTVEIEPMILSKFEEMPVVEQRDTQSVPPPPPPPPPPTTTTLTLAPVTDEAYFPLESWPDEASFQRYFETTPDSISLGDEEDATDEEAPETPEGSPSGRPKRSPITKRLSKKMFGWRKEQKSKLRSQD